MKLFNSRGCVSALWIALVFTSAGASAAGVAPSKCEEYKMKLVENVVDVNKISSAEELRNLVKNLNQMPESPKEGAIEITDAMKLPVEKRPKVLPKFTNYGCQLEGYFGAFRSALKATEHFPDPKLSAELLKVLKQSMVHELSPPALALSITLDLNLLNIGQGNLVFKFSDADTKFLVRVNRRMKELRTGQVVGFDEVEYYAPVANDLLKWAKQG